MRRSRPSPRRLRRYKNIYEVLDFYGQQVVSVLGENLMGIYLTGSLSYRAFRYDSSDIDIAVMVKRRLSPDGLNAIRRLHHEMEEKFAKWARRLECS